MIGTRPEAIKLAPVARALVARGCPPSLILTGQQAVDPPDYGLQQLGQWRLRCPGQSDPHRHVRSVTSKLLSLLRNPPDLLVVHGDTSSALGGALAGFTAGIPVAHVEAGLRTHDRRLPWPEEEYRTAIDSEAELLFAPTERAASNLRDEQVPGEIHVTGNTGIDSLLSIQAALPPRLPSVRKQPRVLVTCHRRESWRDGLDSIAEALIALIGGGACRIDVVLHPNPHVAAKMHQLLGGIDGLALLPPLRHEQLVRRLRDADLALSDSGGIQEEAPALGTPLLVLRDKTERPEGVELGSARLVGTDTRRIVDEALRLLRDPVERAAMAHPSFPYGDGHAAPRIAAIIEEWCGRRTLPWAVQKSARQVS